MYEFEVMYTGIKHNQRLTLIRAMLLHPYKAFKIEDELKISNGAEVAIRIHKGMAINFYFHVYK